MRARLRFPRFPLLVCLGAMAPYLSTLSVSSTAPIFDRSCGLESVAFAVNGEAAPLVSARRGDHVEVTFEVPSGCQNRLTFASFVAPAPAFDGSQLDQQALFSRAAGVFGPGRHSMEIDVYGFGNTQDCGSTSNPSATGQGGANQSGPYDSTCDGNPSQNGNGGGGAGGKPCAGCVGNADDKNPPGQQPGGNDPNAGYECDRNAGIGQGNPAHSGCENVQIDFAYRPSTDVIESVPSHGPGLIAGVFCIRTSPVCYATDRTGSKDAVLGG